MKSYGYSTCFGCGSKDVPVMLEPRYNGLRGRCPNCGGDWPES